MAGERGGPILVKAGAGSDHAEPPLSSHCSSPTSSKLEAILPPAKRDSYETYGTPSISALGRIYVWTP